jgi:adenosylcobinamide kinase/adenosylcobinamide-phosphate guanylyltransferase
LTLLASNVLLALPDDATQDSATGAILAETRALLDGWRAHAAAGALFYVVSNEVGMGVVPPTRLGRFYRDALGSANQLVAREADEVLLLVAGLPWRLKSASGG